MSCYLVDYPPVSYLQRARVYVATTPKVQSLQTYLNNTISERDLGDLKYYLDCTFEYDGKLGTMTVSQPACTERLLVSFDITAIGPISACRTVEVRSCEAKEERRPQLFYEAVGDIMRVANMRRPDISCAVRKVASPFQDLSRNTGWRW